MLISPNSSKEQKVLAYEDFLNNVLKTDLKNALESRDRVYSEMAEYSELLIVLEAMEESMDNKIKSMVEIGCNFYVEALIEDRSKIVVDIGCGLLLEMSGAEAKAFCDRKLSYLKELGEIYHKKQLEIKVAIDTVLQGLREIQNL